MESNVTLIRNLIKENKTYKHVSEILRQSFPEVTRGFSARNVFPVFDFHISVSHLDV